jgi:hypothetical protein
MTCQQDARCAALFDGCGFCCVAYVCAGAKKYAVILAFDVPVAREAREQAEEFGVRIFTADIIYHLFDQFTVSLNTSCLLTLVSCKLAMLFGARASFCTHT